MERVKLPADAEEAITLFVRSGGTVDPDTGRASLFGSEPPAKRFGEDWLALLPRGSPIRALSSCDLSLISKHVLGRKAVPGANPNVQGRPKRKEEPRPESVALVDGRPQPISQWMVTSPGIYRGRGAGGTDASMTGRFRRRLLPSDVTLNLSAGARFPTSPKGRWGAIVHEPSVDWVAKWRDPVTGSMKYARLSGESSTEQAWDREKFDLARALYRALPTLRARVASLLASSDETSRQVGACVWLIDRFALRVGGAGRERNQTFGASTLLRKHLSSRGGVLTLDFPGKDSVRYYRRTSGPGSIPPAALRALASSSSTAIASPSVPLFGSMSPDGPDSLLSDVLEGATPKVLRTCRASEVFERTLDACVPRAMRARGAKGAGGAGGAKGVVEAALTLACARVAALCNHRKGSPAQGVDSRVDLTLVEAQIDRLVGSLREDPASAPAVVRALNARVVRPAGLALATSKSSYIDPRIVYAFYAACGTKVPPKFYSKALSRKFAWAADVDKGYRFSDS
jgi:hypothetical protein